MNELERSARATFIGAAVLTVGATALVLLSRDVRTLERRLAAPADAEAVTA